MKRKIWTAAVAAMLAAGSAAAGGMAPHSHEASAAEAAATTHAGRFTTDPALRQGMESIRGALVGSAGAIHAESFGSRGYRKLAARIERDMASIVANCKLAPEADAQLHGILAELGAGVAAMQEGTNPSRAEGAVRVARALNMYAERFEDPAFRPVAMHAHVGARVAQAGP